MSNPAPVVIEPITPPLTLISAAAARGRITNPTSTITVAAAARPGYLQPLSLAGYGTKITRVGGDYGAATAIGGVWGKVARHHYSVDQPWNDDETMFMLEQWRDLSDNVPNGPRKIICSGSSYLPIIGDANCNSPFALLASASGGSYGEQRWRPGYPRQMVAWNSNTQKITVFDVVSRAVIWTSPTIPNPIIDDPVKPKNFSFASQGTLSDDGRYVVLVSRYDKPQQNGKVDYFCIVDIEAGMAGVSYANGGVGYGPLNFYSNPYPTSKYGEIGWCSISPLANYVVIKYGGTPEYTRCFTVNKTTLVCTPRTFTAGDNPLHPDTTDVGTAPNKAGWMGCTSHGDMQRSFNATLDAAGVECLTGGIRDADLSNHCSDTDKDNLGVVMAQSLAKGTHIHASLGETGLGSAEESADQHCSGRCYLAPGNMLTTYEWNADTARKFNDELVIWSLDGSDSGLAKGVPIRCGTTRTDDQNLTGYSNSDAKYNGEAHGCISPTASKIMFSSNWYHNASPAGPPDDFKAYILEPLHQVNVESNYIPRPEAVEIRDMEAALTAPPQYGEQ